MKTRTMITAIGLTAGLLAIEAGAKTGRPDAPTRGLGVVRAESRVAVAAERPAGVQVGRPEALTRGLTAGKVDATTGLATGLTPEQKPGRPEYHTRGLYCPHPGKRG